MGWYGDQKMKKVGSFLNFAVVLKEPHPFRGTALNLWDLSVSKNFAITEGIKLQLRTEFLNAFNTPFFDNPNLTPNNANFGRLTSQNNLPRDIQIGLRLVF